MAKLTNEEIIATLKEMTILEINDLVKAIEEEFGVTAAVAAAPVAVSTEACGLDLMGAKKIVDGCAPGTPSVIKENVKVEEADKIKEAIHAAGAVVEYK